MPYTLKRTDGTVVVTLPDQTIDTGTLAVALVGRGAINYGTDFAQNFIHLLENFAHTAPPSRPLLGQIWFDRSENRMRYYTGTWDPFDGDATSKSLPNTVVKRDGNGNFEANVITANLKGSADDARKWTSTRLFQISGDASGVINLDGSADVNMYVAVQHSTSADRWVQGRRLTLNGHVRGAVTIDGTGDMVMQTTLDSITNGPINIDIAGNAATATKWKTPMTLILTGDATGQVTFDGGTTPVSLPVSLTATGVPPGTYSRVTLDDRGRIIGADNLTSIDQAKYAEEAGHAKNADHALTADRLTTPRLITLAGGVTGSAAFDGSADITINCTVTGATNGTVTGARNSQGGGVGLFKATDGSTLVFREIKAGANVTFAVDSADNVVTINASGGSGPTDTSGFVLKSGDTMSGALRTPQLTLDDNFIMALPGGTPVIYFNGSKTYLAHDRNGKSYNTVIDDKIVQIVDGNGNFSVTGDLTAFGSMSDRRIKSNIEPLTDSLKVIKSLNGYSYDKTSPVTNVVKSEVGVMAQEVQEAIPTAVREVNGLLSVQHEQIIAHLIESIKTLEARIVELESKKDR